jgi:hypothetical protein
MHRAQLPQRARFSLFDRVAFNERQALCELRLYRDTAALGFPTGELNHLTDRCIDLQAISPGPRFFDEVTDPRNDLARSIAVF